MYTQDPFQMSLAGYRLAGMIVENQMRVMLALADATFSGRNPFLSPPVSHRPAVAPQPTKDAETANPPVARVVKPSATPETVPETVPDTVPETVKAKRPRQPSAPPPMPSRKPDMHPAE